MYKGSPKHPVFSGATFGLMSGEKPLFQPQVEGGHEALGSALQQMGLHAEPTSGKYKESERSYIVHNPTLEQMQQLGKMFGQESIVHSQNGQHRLVYTNGEHEGKYHQAEVQTPIEHFEQPPPDFYTSIPGGGHFRINFDWNRLHGGDLAKGDVVDLNPPAPTGKKKRRNAEVVAIPTDANTDWDAPGEAIHNRPVDPVARRRAVAGSVPEFEEPRLAAKGIGQGKNIYDYTHHLDPIAQQNGNTLTIEHNLGQADDYMVAKVRNSLGQVTDHTWAYPQTLQSGPKGNTAQEGMKSAIQNHANWIRFGQAKKSEREFSTEEAVYLAKNAIAQLLAAHAPAKPHPHAYDWHDGHSDHHREDFAGPQLPGLQKAGETHPHMDAPPAPSQHPSNEQAAGVGVSTYKQFALPYGNVQPGKSSDLLHYKYHGKLPEIEKLVADHGYKTYYAGGRYGKPDLASKNYNTGHLMVYDPSPDSGASFGHEEYTKGWRQIHELSHALVYPELNKIYGEGRRIGKLGHHRTTNEALRAVHWEWLAAHKQRELSKQVGIHVSDQDFHRELNTVMHDAVHRAVTGKFTEPSGEGFTPHSHKVPLHTALQMVRDSAHQMGLKGLHETLTKKSMAKNLSKADLPLKSPAAAGVTRAPGLHDSVDGFMAGLKSLPKGDPSRGKFITAHMNHPGFLSALASHPQGKQLHSMLTQHLNSTANAGLGAGARVTMKSEPNPIFVDSTAEGDTPAMADEKIYSVEEANAILLKATREKVEAFEKSIKDLRDRELRKALVPPHKHNPGMNASGGHEDVPAGKLNPKGVDKSFDKSAIPSTDAAPGTSVGTQPGSAMAMGEKKASEPLCKKCGKSHKSLDKCGDMEVAKADLVAENGKRADNHTVSGSKLPDDAKSKKINEGTASDPGSGGIKLPGANLKKSSNPPMAKPPSGKNMGTSVPTSAPKAPAMKAEGDPKPKRERPAVKCKVCGETKPWEESGANMCDACFDKRKGKLEKAALPGQNVTALAGVPAKGTGGPDLIPSDPAPKPAAKPQYTPAMHAQAKAGLAAQGITPKLPGAGLKSPKAAGVTRGAVAAGPKPSAAPAPAPKPAAAKPGIFGKLLGKAEDKPEKHEFLARTRSPVADCKWCGKPHKHANHIQEPVEDFSAHNDGKGPKPKL